VLQKFGRFSRVIKPGFHVINPWTETVIPIDMKTNIMALQPQKIMTKDTVTLQIETVVYYRTVDPYKMLYKLGTSLQ
jgi:regulator of protease activity HflC (stomatin/prohibitin superfamily)